MADNKTTPKDYSRWGNTGVKVISKPKPKKAPKKGK